MIYHMGYLFRNGFVCVVLRCKLLNPENISGYHQINKMDEFLQFSSKRKGIRAWNFRMMIRKIWRFLWYQNRNNFEKNEKRKDQAPLSTEKLFQLQKHLPKWRQSFVKNGLKKPGVLSKSSKFCVVWPIWFCPNFTSMWYKHVLRNVWRDFRLPMSALATVAGKSFNGKFTAKIDFPIGYFMLPVLMPTVEV